ncbi:MAG TPA: DUF503 domain-containing protein [Phycisphaerae bacterium]|nr:DUF503 domain-containing protein [Phycisphaerae bacterium]HOJ76100.1 DUF503 domain-containing protein [Phycisphaerae bacterium]HOM51858.1 DUF503 domain-containing protein [Phycisphaerae bacterium]HON65772.1 DUF503 domain-containing protein [Phycisphaerae bacterium]HOQ88060.1 DUF503 domain-containing protein [Phycisphaerae bacterium]
MSRMVIGALRLRLVVFGSVSLKDKRRAIKSLKERLIHRFHVSAAEVGSLDHHQHAELGVAMVANDSAFVTHSLDKMVDYVRQDAAASLVDYEIEVF